MLQLWRFCVALIVVVYFESSRLVRSCFSGYGVFKVFVYKVSVRIFFATCNSQSIVWPCKLSYGRHYWPFVYKLWAGWCNPKLFNLRVLSRTLYCFTFGNSTFHDCGAVSMPFCITPVGWQACSVHVVLRLCGGRLVVLYYAYVAASLYACVWWLARGFVLRCWGGKLVVLSCACER